MSQQIYKYFWPQFPHIEFNVFDERPDFDFIEVNQTHSCIIKDSIDCRELPEADGILVSSADTSCRLAIKTADCLPIVVIGVHGHALLHAGWKGVQGNIFLRPEIVSIIPTEFLIGPHISLENYEVQEDFLRHFPDSKAILRRDGKTFFSLEHEATNRILGAFPNAEVISSETCTYANHQFHSYRRNGTVKRNWNILDIKKLSGEEH